MHVRGIALTVRQQRCAAKPWCLEISIRIFHVDSAPSPARYYMLLYGNWCSSHITSPIKVWFFCGDLGMSRLYFGTTWDPLGPLGTPSGTTFRCGFTFSLHLRPPGFWLQKFGFQIRVGKNPVFRTGFETGPTHPYAPGAGEPVALADGAVAALLQLWEQC